MKNAVISAFATRTNALLACSATVLLAASASTAAIAAPAVTHGLTADSASIGTYAQEVVAAAAVSAAVAQAEGNAQLAATAPSTSSAAATATSIYHLYVATNGSDSNAGTQARPFKTINKAASSAKAGTTVHVAAGTYSGNVTTKVSGTSTNRIRFVSDTKWGAKIIGSGTEAMWTNSGSYIDITGFDISGPGRLGVLNNGSNTLVSNNHIHNITVSGGCKGAGGAGIVNANYSGSNGDVIGNVVRDIGKPGACNGVQGIYSSNRGGKIMNNIVYRASAYGIHLWHAATDVTIANNTVFANGSSGMGGGIVIGVGDSPGGVQLKNTKVINNIVYKNPRAGISQYCYSGQACIGSGNVTANNLVYGNGSAITMKVGSATGTISADPKFVSYNPAGTGDYRLQSGSPAANKGTATSAPAVDMLGVARPKGGAFDIGAYENF
ncbi:right-handed parallel beta-helix repeat-containing protein [Massilia niastensis]|uniref:right-handed parallel beta-helix repeat-containing protein n=1 Tax=Massilia niastensis TaxID=544911 RepID=UPI000377ACD7|nr:right-handed parallel beta-helix repeat-containing protein [Massilia niastensis]